MLWCRKPKNKPHGVDHMTALPSDVLVAIFSFLSASDFDENVKLICKTFRREGAKGALWRAYCLRTGKLCMNESTNSSTDYRSIYYKKPCVPEDFESITTALSRCPPGGIVTLLPGVYEETLDIQQSVHIQAAFPEQGAAIVWYEGVNEPCVRIDKDGTEQSVHVSLSHVQLLHSTKGADIWGGNCAVMVEGEKTCLSLTSCSLQSDSGRGVVTVDGATLQLQSSVIHDCAATGLYLGGSDSMASVKGCNIIRNGEGSRRARSRNSLAADDDDSDRVPAGHSGMYIEAGVALLENSLVAGNALTGLSVVRGGVVRISGCDVTENGSDPILVEDHIDVDQEGRNNNLGVMEGPVPNNYNSRDGSSLSLDDEMILTRTIDASKQQQLADESNRRIVLGGKLRATPFDNVVERRMSTKALERRYRIGDI